ncbi:glyoxalase [Flavobacterium sp. LS1P28]|uniref:Glyoxalase n=1 Tax=Flavobacterium bomense TaxID=2497483 RepID=A0A3S0MFZ3_9FLAO|nr:MULTISPECIES: glyoxalase [Flavobacterium]RTY82028.1 glyoxalase [Flavobacterium sp. LS1P28]RTY84575.1 glyoxalase [Flavobacterium sp. ZB4P23]RTZ05756.1 glyoxalase [Flavobacterium sp. GSP6]RTZ07102.1 glyoxalase [Flavobacterium bomense]
MNARDTFLKEFRGQTIGSVTTQSTTEESFQNEVLRPILKLQNDLFAASFLNYVNKNKIDFYSYTLDKKVSVMENAIQKDIKFRNSLKGMIIGLFTADEYAAYVQNSSNINKRMMSMLVERLKSHVSLYEINKSN